MAQSQIQDKSNHECIYILNLRQTPAIFTFSWRDVVFNQDSDTAAVLLSYTAGWKVVWT